MVVSSPQLSRVEQARGCLDQALAIRKRHLPADSVVRSPLNPLPARRWHAARLTTPVMHVPPLLTPYSCWLRASNTVQR